MAELRVERAFRNVLDRLDESGIIKEASVRSARMIRSRTPRGIDIFGNQFASYAEYTARRKGRFRPVSLHETGRFINNHVPMRVRGSWHGGTTAGRRGGVKPQGLRTRRLSRFHMLGTRYMPARKYLGLTERQEGRIHEFVQGKVASVVRKEFDVQETVPIEINLG